MLDVDHFKQINDSNGHAAGDAILKSVANTLIEQCRPSDLVCRIGGDEFCLLIRDNNEADAAILAERLCQALNGLRVPLGGKLLGTTGSFGVAERSADMDGPAHLIEEADQALLAAKQAGRNCVARASSLVARTS